MILFNMWIYETCFIVKCVKEIQLLHFHNFCSSELRRPFMCVFINITFAFLLYFTLSLINENTPENCMLVNSRICDQNHKN